MEHAPVKHEVAVVVPVLGDVDALAELLSRIEGWEGRPEEIVVVAGQREESVVAAQREEIVVAGRPDPRLGGLCRDRGCRLVETQANRGAQLDCGARRAGAGVLWFLHADVEPPHDGLEAIGSAVADGAEGGCFRFAFQGQQTWYKRLLERFVALRVALGGMPYGDQGIFVRRDVYLECGGFPHQSLFEEVRLVQRLRRRGRFRPLAQPVRVSTRRWERDGWWSRTWRNRLLAFCNMLGIPPEKLAGVYHGKGRPRAARDGCAAGTEHDRGAPDSHGDRGEPDTKLNT